jgi:hypothetical protein
VGAYSIGIVTGGISADRRIDVVHLGIIIFAVSVATLILQPEILRRFKALELKGFKLEMLEKVKEKQVEQKTSLMTSASCFLFYCQTLSRSTYPT